MPRKQRPDRPTRFGVIIQGWFPDSGGLKRLDAAMAAALRDRVSFPGDLPSGFVPSRPPLPLRGQSRIFTGFPILRADCAAPWRFTVTDLMASGNALWAGLPPKEI